MTTPLRMKLERAQTALVIVDLQERLSAAMEPARLAHILNRTSALIAGARALELPVVLTEQYSKGLGPTVPSVREALAASFAPIEKMTFTACTPEAYRALGTRSQVLICGMETHVCVFQTVRDLAMDGRIPFLCADASISRTEEDHRIGLERCREVGGVLTTAESALFDLLGQAGSPEFKAISAAVK